MYRIPLRINIGYDAVSPENIVIVIIDQFAQEIIQKEIPQEESVVLTLTDIMLDKSGCYNAFALGYDMGESPAGHLYVLVSFNENFTAQQDVIYETL